MLLVEKIAMMLEINSCVYVASLFLIHFFAVSAGTWLAREFV